MGGDADGTSPGFASQRVEHALQHGSAKRRSAAARFGVVHRRFRSPRCQLKPTPADALCSLPAGRVIRALGRIIEWRGRPRAIRCDNDPEYISGARLTWAERHGIRIGHIQPGKPRQNAQVERYNRTVRYARLARILFDSIDQMRDRAARRLRAYNHEHPNMALGGITPMQKPALAAWLHL